MFAIIPNQTLDRVEISKLYGPSSNEAEIAGRLFGLVLGNPCEIVELPFLGSLEPSIFERMHGNSVQHPPHTPRAFVDNDAVHFFPNDEGNLGEIIDHQRKVVSSACISVGAGMAVSSLVFLQPLTDDLRYHTATLILSSCKDSPGANPRLGVY